MDIIKQWVNKRGYLDARLYISGGELFLDYNLCRETVELRSLDGTIADISSFSDIKKRYKTYIESYIELKLI